MSTRYSQMTLCILVHHYLSLLDGLTKEACRSRWGVENNCCGNQTHWWSATSFPSNPSLETKLKITSFCSSPDIVYLTGTHLTFFWGFCFLSCADSLHPLRGPNRSSYYQNSFHPRLCLAIPVLQVWSYPPRAMYGQLKRASLLRASRIKVQSSKIWV